MTILDDILARKREEVARLERVGLAELRRRAAQADAPRGFARALGAGPVPRVIAEFKRASPSKGDIAAGADPSQVAQRYAEAGAVALSVLTDRAFFKGDLEDLRAAREACALPVLRKDFTVSELQIAEARAAGADAVLLIVAALQDAELRELRACAVELGLDVLVEVHTESDVERALAAGVDLVGINNRDLRTFETDLEVTRALLPLLSGCTVVSESGLGRPEQLRALSADGVHAFLVGESLMRTGRPGEALRELRGEGA